MLTRDVAQQIVGEIIDKLGRNINIMDQHGTIIGSGDSKRIGTVHEGALKVLEKGEPVYIRGDKFSGSKPGINLPITLQGDRVGVVGITGNPDVLAEFGALVVMMTELMLQRFALLDESEWKERLKGYLLDECLKDDVDENKVQHKAKLLDIEINAPFRLIVFFVRKPKESSGKGHNMYREIAEALDGASLFYDFVDDEHFVVLISSTNQEADIPKYLMPLFQKYYHIIRIVIDDPYLYLSETKRKYQRMLKALRISKEPIIHTKDVQQILLLDSANVEEVKYYLELTLALPNDLQTTLEAFFANDLNISQTAQALFIHRNTMIYRLDRIADITGKDPRNFKNAWELQCGLWLFCTISDD